MENFVKLTREGFSPPSSETCNNALVACCNSCGFPMGEVQVADGIVICPNCGRFKKVLIKKGKATVSDPDEKELMNSRLMRYLISIGLVIILD